MTANNPPKLGAILLAAGGSSRLGRPKQLVQYEGQTLLRRAARSLAESVYFPVVVVLGAGSDTAISELSGLPLYAAVNDKWSEGLSSSIQTGLRKLTELELSLDGTLIALCDQPKITAKMLDSFAVRFSETQAAVIAASYENVAGVPALFSRELFSELLALTGDNGARQIIRNRKNVITIDLPEAAVDIDTPADVSQEKMKVKN